MAGTIPISMTQQFGDDDLPLAGGKLYLIQAGTVSTPQNGFQDSALTLPWPNPIILSASGRIPQFFLADGSIKIRLTDANGVAVAGMTVDGLVVTGASSGGGGGSPVDATTILATGDIKVKYGTGVLSGFVRCNARTLGSATSGASERANADTQALFEYLWNTDPNLTVSTGRGASSIADWGANKTITLPDWRGRAIAALDDMGNTAAGRLTATYFGTSAIVLGAAGGAESKTLAAANMAAHTHSGTTGNDSPDHTHTTPNILVSTGVSATPSGPGFSGSVANVASGGASARHTHAFTTDSGTGTGTPVAIASPMMLATVYLKL
jgi:microcystin-dependent protein